jgi:hypothetical protein
MFDFIFNPSISFQERLRRVFDYQLAHNRVYQTFSGMFDLPDPENLSPASVPLLPIRAFKEGILYTEASEPELLFKSSGTAGHKRSVHRVAYRHLYKKSVEEEFYRHFPKDETSILCYTPGYNENPESSLTWMLNHLVNQDPSGLSGFLPLDKAPDATLFTAIADAGRKPVLFGAAFGLLDMIDAGTGPLPPETEVIETGGMKTYRREMSKTMLRERLAEGFSIPQNQIHSEYGMCELLSQSYAIGGEWFASPHWAELSVRNPNDPSLLCEPGEEGMIGIIDLANICSCPFILTEDRGVSNRKGEIRVLGRWHGAELRGCNFLIDRD